MSPTLTTEQRMQLWRAIDHALQAEDKLEEVSKPLQACLFAAQGNLPEAEQYKLAQHSEEASQFDHQIAHIGGMIQTLLKTLGYEQTAGEDLRETAKRESTT